MSDFLTSLVARSFGAAPVIRPRVTSLFEPVRGELAALHNAFDSRNEETIAVQEEEGIVQASGNRRSQTPLKILSRPDDAHRAIPHRAEIAASPLEIGALPPHSQAGQTLVPETHVAIHEANILLEPSARADGDDRLTVGHTGTGEPELRLSRNLPVPVVNVPVMKREGTKDDKSTLLIPPRVVPAVIDPERIVRPSEDPSVPGASARRLADQAGTKDAPGQLIPPKLPAELRMSDLAFTARPEKLQRGEMDGPALNAPAAEPTVQVTIGRIEVRASKEKSYSSQATAASPVMPLDEYLRKRSQRVGQ